MSGFYPLLLSPDPAISFSSCMAAPVSLSDHEFLPIWGTQTTSSEKHFYLLSPAKHEFPKRHTYLPSHCCSPSFGHWPQVIVTEALLGVMNENYWCQSVENIALKSTSAENQTGESWGGFLQILGGALLTLSAQTNSIKHIFSVHLWGVKNGEKSPFSPWTSTLRWRWNVNQVVLPRGLQANK